MCNKEKELNEIKKEVRQLLKSKEVLYARNNGGNLVFTSAIYKLIELCEPEEYRKLKETLS